MTINLPTIEPVESPHAGRSEPDEDPGEERFTIHAFVERCLLGYLCDDDGSGFYLTAEGEVTTHRAVPSSVLRDGPQAFPAVVWYAK